MAQQQRRNGNGNGNGGRTQDEGQGRGQGVQFNEGQTVHVWKPTGVRKLKYGIQTSEKTGGEFPDIHPDEPLKVIKKFGSGKAICKRANGQEVIVHKNHVDQNSKYYAVRLARQESQGSGQGQGRGGRPSMPASPQERLQSAKETMDRAKQEYEEAMSEVEAVAEELSQDLPSGEDEDEDQRNVG